MIPARISCPLAFRAQDEREKPDVANANPPNESKAIVTAARI
jgi:hypothetical protein